MSRSLRLRTVNIKLSFPQQIVEEHEHVRDTTHPPKHYGRIYVTRSLYEVTFPMSYRNVGSSCPHYRERRRSPHRTDSDALYAAGGGNTGPASSVTTNFTPYYLDKKHRREDTPVFASCARKKRASRARVKFRDMSRSGRFVMLQSSAVGNTSRTGHSTFPAAKICCKILSFIIEGKSTVACCT